MLTDDEPRLRWGWPAEIAMAGAVGVVQVLGTSLVSGHQPEARSLDALGYLLLAAGPVILPLRRLWPVAALWLVFAATLGYQLTDYPDGPVWLPLIITFGTVLVSGRRVIAYGFLACGYVAFTWLPKAVDDKPSPSMAEVLGLAAWLLLLAAAAELVRNRRAVAQASRQRAVEAQRAREEQARRQASDERLRIARELHDVLAHSISMINVQAGVGLELIDQRPEQARSALAAIKQASRDALVEVQGVLGSLRQAGEEVPRAPTPGLADVDRLARGAEAAGLVVHVQTTGEPEQLPAGVDLAGFRIVQEALTNVVRHADAATATVRLEYRTGELFVQVDDDGRAGSGASRANGGNGIAGMRERADALGGRFTAAPRPTGGFRVQALLPIHSQPEEAP